MTFENLQYYKLNRSLLFLIGFWENNDSWLNITYRSFILLALITGVVSQVSAYVTAPIVLDEFFVCAPNMLYIITAAVKYAQFLYNISEFEVIIKYINDDWRNLRDAREIRIMHQYARHTQIMTMAFTILLFTTLSIVITCEGMTAILDVMVPLNKSRKKTFVGKIEYFVNPDDYKLLIVTHIILVVFSATATIAATESAISLIIKHVCALLKIASYRIQQSLNDFALVDLMPGTCNSNHQKMVEAIRIHNTAIKSVSSPVSMFAPLLENVATSGGKFNAQSRVASCFLIATVKKELFHSSFIEFAKEISAESYCFLLIVGICGISMNLYALAQALGRNEKDKVLVLLMCSSVQFSYMLITNYIGQEVIDHSSSIFEDVYATVWYRIPLRIRKLIPLIMMRSRKHCTLIIGGLYVPSFEGMSMLCSTSLSYFTVIYSILS